jgi:hypothetical protein
VNRRAGGPQGRGSRGVDAVREPAVRVRAVETGASSGAWSGSARRRRRGCRGRGGNRRRDGGRARWHVQRGGGLGCRGGDPERLAALLILLEHRWAIRCANAVMRAGECGCCRVHQPLDLVGVGLVAAAEATHWLLHRPTRSDWRGAPRCCWNPPPCCAPKRAANGAWDGAPGDAAPAVTQPPARAGRPSPFAGDVPGWPPTYLASSA